MSLIRTLFLGTPDIARYCLESLLEDEHFSVVGVITQPDRPAGRKMKLTPSPVKELALKKGLEVHSFDSVNTPEALAQVASWRAEVAVVVAFGQIVSQKFLDLFPHKVVNVHASLLPRWRGAAPIQRALMAGDKETGVCLQVMVKELDAGDVLGSRTLVIKEDWDALELHEQMKPLAADLLKVELMDYLRGNLVAVPQNPTQITYAHKLSKSESAIDWTLPARQIFNRMRGLALGPGVHCQRGDKPLKILRAQVEVKDGNQSRGSAAFPQQPGQVLKVDKDSFVVACGEQALRVFEVQPPSRPRMAVGEYLKGYPLAEGEVLQ